MSRNASAPRSQPRPRAKKPDARFAQTAFLRVPVRDWPHVVGGHKRELRLPGTRARKPRTPTPAVGYCVRQIDPEPATALLVIEAMWEEPLGAISPASIAAEGFDSLAEFRSYWRARAFSYKPLSIVTVYRIRPFTPADTAQSAHDLIEHLYGPWL